jgi:tetratricopeptide (TPR) repeat protein
VHDQTQRWAETYDRELTSILAVQHDVAGGVAEALALELLPEERTRLATARQINPAAHEAYLKGRFHWYRFTPEDFVLAQRYFEEALRIDADYAPAYVGLADAIGTPGHRGLVPPQDVFPAAKAAVERALELDDRLAAALDLHARIRFAYDWDWVGSEESFQRAIELNPNYPDAHVVYAQLLRITGRGEAALAEVQHGLEMDPYNAFFQQQFALQLSAAGRHAEATARLQALLAAQPGFPPAHETLWATLYKEGRYEEALHQAVAFLGDRELGDVLTGSYASIGYAGAMKRAADILARRSTEQYVAPVLIAGLYVHADDIPAALEWLERAIAVHDTQIVYTTIVPVFEKLWDHPRFREIRRRINLPG